MTAMAVDGSIANRTRAGQRRPLWRATVDADGYAIRDTKFARLISLDGDKAWRLREEPTGLFCFGGGDKR